MTIIFPFNQAGFPGSGQRSSFPVVPAPSLSPSLVDKSQGVRFQGPVIDSGD